MYGQSTYSRDHPPDSVSLVRGSRTLCLNVVTGQTVGRDFVFVRIGQF